jgi:5-formyltetrahydrofolate cyclo-ligase
LERALLPPRCLYHSTKRDMSALSGSPNDVVARKKVFRRKIRASMKDLSAEDTLSQSQQVWDTVFGLPVYQSAKSVGLFLSMPTGEINTDPIIQNAIENGKTVYVPQVGANFEKCEMELLKVILNSPDPMFHKSWPKNRWQIPEPPASMPTVPAKPGDLDVLIVPGLGFDSKANRLGHGKGFYDRFIERMTTNNTQLPLVAVALEAQFVDEDIPVDTYDKQMDMVVLPSRVIIQDRL